MRIVRARPSTLSRAATSSALHASAVKANCRRRASRPVAALQDELKPVGRLQPGMAVDRVGGQWAQQLELRHRLGLLDRAGALHQEDERLGAAVHGRHLRPADLDQHVVDLAGGECRHQMLDHPDATLPRPRRLVTVSAPTTCSRSGRDRRRARPVGAAEPDARALCRRAEREADPRAAVEADAGAADHVTKCPLLPYHQRTSGSPRFRFRRAPPPTACPRPRDGPLLRPASHAGNEERPPPSLLRVAGATSHKISTDCYGLPLRWYFRYQLSTRSVRRRKAGISPISSVAPARVPPIVRAGRALRSEKRGCWRSIGRSGVGAGEGELLDPREQVGPRSSARAAGRTTGSSAASATARPPSRPTPRSASARSCHSGSAARRCTAGLGSLARRAAGFGWLGIGQGLTALALRLEPEQAGAGARLLRRRRLRGTPPGPWSPGRAAGRCRSRRPRPASGPGASCRRSSRR